jgi:hypothetical protein
MAMIAGHRQHAKMDDRFEHNAGEEGEEITFMTMLPPPSDSEQIALRIFLTNWQKASLSTVEQRYMSVTTLTVSTTITRWTTTQESRFGTRSLVQTGQDTCDTH